MKKPVRRPAAKKSQVGEVVFLSEKLKAARELSSSCVGTEALLETSSKPGNVNRHNRTVSKPDNPKKT